MTARPDLAAPPGLPARAARRSPHSLLRQDRRFGYLLAAPVVLVLLAITAYPLFYNVWNSFHHVDYLAPPLGGFAGLSNYAKLFTDHQFVPALVHTAGFTVVSVSVETVIGLALAVALSKRFRGRGIVRAASFIPWAVPTVVSAELWKTMFDPQQGFVNYVLGQLHLPLASTTWLDNTWTAWAAILIADDWRNIPFMAIVLLAGLQVIPNDLYEAASVDGASKLQQFWRITLPLLRPAILVTLIFRTLDALRVFDVFQVFFGYRLNAQTMAVYTQSTTVNDGHVGYGAAMSVAIFLIISLFVVIYVTFMRVTEE